MPVVTDWYCGGRTVQSSGTVYVDARREGQHGIARFGQEVIKRLSTPFKLLGGPADPLSLVDLVNPDRLRLHKEDIVFSPGFHCGPTRARQLIVLHDLIQITDPVESDWKKSLYYRHLIRPAAQQAGIVLTVSESARREVSRWLGDAVSVVDVGNGCSDSFFKGQHSQERSGLLYVGNLKPHKNPQAAFAGARAVADVKLTVVTGDVREAVALARQYGIEDRVDVQTGVSDTELAALYQSAAALVLPSLAEGFGLPAAEALAGDCPVIFWSGCHSVAEIVGSDGISVGDAHDVREWAQAIRRVTNGLVRVESAHRIERQFSWHSVAGRVDDALTSLRS